VTILDAYAVIALLRGEPAADAVQELLAVDADAALTALGLAEVVDFLVRLARVDEEDAALDVAQLRLADMDPVTAEIALRAGLLRARHYHRHDRAVGLADCVVAETARARTTSVVTSDPHLLDTCAAEGIAVIPLPDSQGRTWSP